ncbi:MAG: RHS repeat-associated core domain-containing protein, partial [Xanthomonadales bacterium]|nr:RHS repeat-associated core domain-containing protein [Xanthomonadales bacterium]
DLTTRGFTGHEHLNETDLIHMNGRVYDYNLGRFYSVDPFIQFPENSQSVNGYSYILNNPLSGTDPSGYQSNSDVDTQTAAGSSSGGNSAMDTAKARIHKTAPTGSNIKSQVRIAVNGGTAEFSSSGELLSGSGNLRGLLSTLIVSGNGGVSTPTINMGNGQGNTGQDSPDGLSDVGKPGTGGNGMGNSLNAQMDATGCQVPYKCDSNLIDTKPGIKANSVTADTLPSGSQGAGVSVPHWAKNPLGFAMFALTYSQGISISADRADEYNRQIFRVVNPAEYAILQTTGQFPPSPSGFEEKQFWVRIEHAHKWVERLHMRGWESSVAIISTLVRDSTFRLSVDVNEPGIGYFRSFGPEALPILNRDAQEFGIYTHKIIGDGFE